jgi:hypothetical protein
MNSDSGMSGPPAPVKAILKQFGSKKEEDKMVGFLNFLKSGPKLLKWVPGDKAKDLRTWLTVYSYWNQGGMQNVVSMLYKIIQDLNLVDASSLSSPSSNIEQLSSSSLIGTKYSYEEKEAVMEGVIEENDINSELYKNSTTIHFKPEDAQYVELGNYVEIDGVWRNIIFIKTF